MIRGANVLFAQWRRVRVRVRGPSTHPEQTLWSQPELLAGFFLLFLTFWFNSRSWLQWCRFRLSHMWLRHFHFWKEWFQSKWLGFLHCCLNCWPQLLQPEACSRDWSAVVTESFQRYREVWSCCFHNSWLHSPASARKSQRAFILRTLKGLFVNFCLWFTMKEAAKVSVAPRGIWMAFWKRLKNEIHPSVLSFLPHAKYQKLK